MLRSAACQTLAGSGLYLGSVIFGANAMLSPGGERGAVATLTAVSEPGSWAMVLVGLASRGRWRLRVQR